VYFVTRKLCLCAFFVRHFWPTVREASFWPGLYTSLESRLKGYKRKYFVELFATIF
jgi:hypothetical protein